MKKIVLFSLVCVFTASCSSTKEVKKEPYSQLVLSNSAGVAYEYNDVVGLQEITEKATMHCSSEAKKPVLISVSTSKNGHQVASYNCE